jgi:DNA polymerase I-like protein with 3'-5' exonuclease and polymerase domains
VQPRKLVPFNTDSLNITINDHAALEAFFASRKDKGGAIGHDVETTVHEDFFNRKMRTSQFGDQKEQHVQDLLELCDGDPELLANAQGHFGKNLHLAPKLEAYVKSVQKVLESGDFTKVGVNLGFEYMTWYWCFGIRMWKLWDCSQVERVIYAGAHSLKQYSFFALDAMAERYFGTIINKDLQTSFTIGDPLSLEQFKYACVDTRVPMGLKGAQQIVLDGRTSKNNTNPANASILAYLDPLLTGDDLNKAAEIENDCIGAFTDMHVHGDRIDTERWLARVAKKKLLLTKNIQELDAIFIPLEGKKTDIVTDEDIAMARAKWKVHAEETTAEKEFKKVTQAELDLGKQIRAGIKAEQPVFDLLNQKDQIKHHRLLMAAELAEARIAVKEVLKKEASELGKKRTRLKKLAAQCEGEALIHYKSNAQLKKSLIKNFPSLKNLKKLDDDVLQAHKKKHPVMALILTYHKLSKEIGTYGDQWAKCWVTHPCKEEGWLNPGDGRLHPVYNPFDAETGRSSSEKPNGQNLPQDPEIRQCFIADPPDESVRICRECKTECEKKFNNGNSGYVCVTCQLLKAIEDTDPEEFILLTCDMSGAELRIIAELSGDPIWIGCFERGEDVHSVGTEILQGQKWIDGTAKLGDLDKKGNPLPECAYYAINPETGKAAKQKCECPGHKVLRNGTKAINFLLAYGGGPQKLAQELGVTVDEAVALMELHESMFPRVWAYLSKSGMNAKMTKKAFDLFGGRRLFPKPTVERAIQWCRDRKEEKLRLPEETCQKNIAAYIVRHGKKPDKDTLFDITHRKPTQKEINSGLGALAGSIERQGKNHAIQGSNARIAKVAFGSGFDNNGSPFLWHLLPQWKAKSIKFVHDEIVISCPKRFALQVANAVQDCIKRAAGLVMKSVIMESEYNIDTHWSK